MQAISINNKTKRMTEQPINNTVEGLGFTGAHHASVLRPFRLHSLISLHFGKNLRLNAKPKAHKTQRVFSLKHNKKKKVRL